MELSRRIAELVDSLATPPAKHINTSQRTVLCPRELCPADRSSSGRRGARASASPVCSHWGKFLRRAAHSRGIQTTPNARRIESPEWQPQPNRECPSAYLATKTTVHEDDGVKRQRSKKTTGNEDDWGRAEKTAQHWLRGLLTLAGCIQPPQCIDKNAWNRL